MAEDDASVSNLFKEIDEEIRQDKATALWKKYGNTFIGAVVAVVVAVGAYEGWKAYDLSTRTELGEKYASALDLAREDNFNGASEAFKALAGESGSGYSVLARLQEAGLLARQGKYQEAANSYFLIAQNGEIDQVYRDMALVMGGLNGLDSISTDEIIQRLQPLATGASAWRFGAQEVLAYAHAKAGDKTKAAEMMKTLSEEAGAPPGVRQRASEFAQAYAN